MPMNKPSILAIIGPTASGKTAASLEIAEHFNGEIICADSRTIYRGMDIGTAKPTVAEQQRVPHHLINVVNPDERFTVADFQRHANRAIRDIQERGHLPTLVGGTGLYIDAVLYNYSFRSEIDPAERKRLAEQPLEQLQYLVDGLGAELNDSDYRNPRRLIRAIETAGQASDRQPLRNGAHIIGINPPKDVLEERIRSRVQQMIKRGFLDEVRRTGEQYGWDIDATSGIGYRAFAAVVRGELNVDEASEAFERGDMQLARRQLTWFKRNPDVTWCESSAEAVKLASALLQNAV